MSWADEKNQGKIVNPKSADGRRMENAVNKSPTLKKLRAASRGEKYSEISTDAPSEEYKANYDKIDFTKRLDEPKNYRVKINGRYVDDNDQEKEQ